MAAPEPVDPAVAARIVEWLTAWHRDADPGEDTPYATVTILDSVGKPLGQAVLTRRQADELAAWQAGVASTTSAPWAMAGELSRWFDPAPATPAATVVFAEPYGGAAYPVPPRRVLYVPVAGPAPPRSAVVDSPAAAAARPRGSRATRRAGRPATADQSGGRPR
jgi:hypothetical protein